MVLTNSDLPSSRHYDVISAPPEGWNSEPFVLTGRNGYIYGRGVTDNKGPILAVACAAASLLSRRALGLDLVFLIEGEEESGSAGFADTVRKHKVGIVVCLVVPTSFKLDHRTSSDISMPSLLGKLQKIWPLHYDIDVLIFQQFDLDSGRYAVFNLRSTRSCPLRSRGQYFGNGIGIFELIEA